MTMIMIVMMMSFVIRWDTSPGSSWTASSRSWRETPPSFRSPGVFRYSCVIFSGIKERQQELTFQIAVYRFVGPSASKLTASHGGHVVCMTGALVATLGLLAASFVNTIPLLILCYAVITGLGFGLMYIPAIVACVPYFTKNRCF